MRITGGIYRSRSLRAPRGDATRPTSDRVREALFSILSSSIGGVRGARVLDLYAGTGALAFESISRGAAFAVLVENGRDALQSIRENASDLGVVESVRVISGDVTRAASLLARETPFDIVLADPPYAVATTEAPRALAAVVAAGLIAPEGVVVLEHAAKATPPAIAGLDTTETRRYGDTMITFYRCEAR